jgi:hypothetical protein
VERDPHQRRLDDLVVAEGAIQVGWVEVGDPVPQRQIRRRGLLGLQCDDPRDSVDNAEPLAGEQQLAGERRPVELTGGDGSQSARQMYGGSMSCWPRICAISPTW